jgi:hypothetical protein
MKVTLKRVTTVTNGQLVQLNSSNIAEPLNTGSILGVAENCRQIQVQEKHDSPVETFNICEVVIDGACQAILSGTAPATGGFIYAAGSNVSITASGEKIGRLIPRGWSESSSFSDGETVTVFICGVS